MCIVMPFGKYHGKPIEEVPKSYLEHLINEGIVTNRKFKKVYQYIKTKKDMSKIELKQKPIISHDLVAVGKSVTDRITELNLDKQVATVDTVKSLKETRATLNKEYAAYEDQRKAVKKAVSDPYTEFDSLYKTEIANKYTDAKETLTDKIATVENAVKLEKQANIKAYFTELCQSEEIDFLTFANLNLDIKLSITEKKYKEQCNDFVSKIKDDLALIETQEFKVEILVDYKQTLNATKAIKTIQDRKAAEAEELERVKQKEYIRRSNLLVSSELKADKETESYVYNDKIYVSWASVKDIEVSLFQSKLIELQEKIKAHELELAAALKDMNKDRLDWPSPVIEVFKDVPNCPIVEPEVIKAPEVLKAPEKKEVLETVSAKFEVSGTYPELKKLGEYMKANNLTYKNIKDE